MLIPLALTQFIASFAGSNMNVAITNISKDLDTTVHGVQTAITLFLLCMAALMIPGSKLTDIWGRKRCLTRGLSLYGIGAVIAALAPGLGVLIVGYSAFEGVGSALMIPPRRASFLLQAAVVAIIIYLSLKITDPLPAELPCPPPACPSS
jgi:MFS family permease